MDMALVDETVASLHERQPAFDWVGVYLVDGHELVLGPFRGLPTEHVRIPMGEGVCGSVAASGRTEVVPDSNTLDAFGEAELDAVERAAEAIAARA